MAIQKFVYVSGPRMGTNNYMNGVELSKASKKKTKGKKNGSKKRSKA